MFGPIHDACVHSARYESTSTLTRGNFDAGQGFEPCGLQPPHTSRIDPEACCLEDVFEAMWLREGMLEPDGRIWRGKGRVEAQCY